MPWRHEFNAPSHQNLQIGATDSPDQKHYGICAIIIIWWAPRDRIIIEWAKLMETAIKLQLICSNSDGKNQFDNKTHGKWCRSGEISSAAVVFAFNQWMHGNWMRGKILSFIQPIKLTAIPFRYWINHKAHIIRPSGYTPYSGEIGNNSRTTTTKNQWPPRI